jgi:hypothetical protein
MRRTLVRPAIWIDSEAVVIHADSTILPGKVPQSVGNIHVTVLGAALGTQNHILARVAGISGVVPAIIANCRRCSCRLPNDRSSLPAPRHLYPSRAAHQQARAFEGVCER